MTTPTRTSSNKTALRASLKKEDDSLADRLVGADAPLVATSEAAELDPPAAAAPRARRTAARPAAKPAAPAASAAKAAAPAAGAAKAPARTTTRKAATAKPASAQAGAVAKAKARPASTRAARPQAGAAKAEGPVEMLEKVARQKRDKLVSYSLKLLKSEEAAIDALRDELSRAAGWAASKSDILRAGVRVFAEQKLEQMQALLGTLATPAEGKQSKKNSKKGKKKK
ncbi:MAG: hypothetical protein KDI64_02395 [Candidatus Accumulibacter sp.]|nr:hypothetical protein [Accumulibacter sp.]